MKSKRRRSRARSAKQKLTAAGASVGFTEAEEAFFRAGAAAPEPASVESFDDLDHGYRPRSLFERLFSRAQTA